MHKDIFVILGYYQSLEEHVSGECFICSTCGGSYKHLRNLQRHQKYECGVEPKFTCPVCAYKFKRKDHLQNHIRVKHRYQETFPINIG